jgi:hypothetical protein
MTNIDDQCLGVYFTNPLNALHIHNQMINDIRAYDDPELVIGPLYRLLARMPENAIGSSMDLSRRAAWLACEAIARAMMKAGIDAR